MSHVEMVHIDVNKMVDVEPIKTAGSLQRLMWFCVVVGIVTMLWGLSVGDPSHVWGAYYVNLVFWMGLAVGSCVIPVIFQIVRAVWSPPIRRIGEANVAFLPWAYMLLLTSYLGRQYIFPWANAPMPGREWWMQPEFVYVRFALLMGFLFYLLHRFVRMSLRGDIGLIQERAANKDKWSGYPYNSITSGWKGIGAEVKTLQPKLSWNAPAIIIAYAIIYSLFAFEMIMSMDTVWYSNMFGGFIFVGNIYLGWAAISFITVFLKRHNADYSKVVTNQQFWDLGKLTCAFAVLWGYLFFSQFLPQWYGNLPEETQWMILRTREYPWKSLGWVTLSMSFVLPFILLLSRDLKKAPAVFATVCLIIFVGIWLEKYMIIMPQLSPSFIPFSAVEVGIFFGFLGMYVLSITSFLAKYPFIPISHPLTHGSTEW